LRAQVYARKRFQGLNCCFAQLCAELLLKRPSPRLRGSPDDASVSRFVSCADAAQNRRKRNERFAARNQTFRNVGRKSLKSL
jgi:hypothetical protein